MYNLFTRFCCISALKLVKLHQKFVAPRVIELAEHAVKTGEPIIRPMWWFDPEDKHNYDIEDQFLIGEFES